MYLSFLSTHLSIVTCAKNNAPIIPTITATASFSYISLYIGIFVITSIMFSMVNKMIKIKRKVAPYAVLITLYIGNGSS